jgi:hypothetical protein
MPFAMALAPFSGAAAEETAAEGEDRSETISVTGVRQAYRGNFTVSEIPQSIAEISAKTLEQNGIQRLTDALDLNASVVRQNTLGGLWDLFAIRASPATRTCRAAISSTASTAAAALAVSAMWPGSSGLRCSKARRPH